MDDGKDLAVFVYGSLQPGGRNWARYCEGKVVEMKPARVKGRLYRLGDGFPGLVVEEAGSREMQNAKCKTQNGQLDTLKWVKGWWMQLKDEEALAGFDQLENYQKGRVPEENDYQRIRVMCYAEKGGKGLEPLAEAWTYVMTPERVDLDGGVEVPSGQWVEPQA